MRLELHKISLTSVGYFECVLSGKQGPRKNSYIYLLNEEKLLSNLKKTEETHSSSAKWREITGKHRNWNQRHSV